MLGPKDTSRLMLPETTLYPDSDCKTMSKCLDGSEWIRIRMYFSTTHTHTFHCASAAPDAAKFAMFRLHPWPEYSWAAVDARVVQLQLWT